MVCRRFEGLKATETLKEARSEVVLTELNSRFSRGQTLACGKFAEQTY